MTADQVPLHLLESWLLDLQADRANGTIKRYRGATLRFLSWYQQQEQQALVLADLTPITLVSYRTDLQRAHAPSTVTTHVSALRAWLTEHGYLSENPAQRFKQVRRTDPSAPHSLSPKQVHTLLRQAARTRHPARDLALVQLLLQTGTRIGECAALTWGDIRFGEKQGQVLVRRGKGNKARSIPLNTSARTALAGYVAPLLRVEPTLKAVARAWPSHPNGPLWISQKGGQLSVSAIGRMIDELVRSSRGLPEEASAHWLRHTFATRYLATLGIWSVSLACSDIPLWIPPVSTSNRRRNNSRRPSRNWISMPTYSRKQVERLSPMSVFRLLPLGKNVRC